MMVMVKFPTVNFLKLCVPSRVELRKPSLLVSTWSLHSKIHHSGLPESAEPTQLFKLSLLEAEARFGKKIK